MLREKIKTLENEQQLLIEEDRPEVNEHKLLAQNARLKGIIHIKEENHKRLKTYLYFRSQVKVLVP